jgi:cytochrome c553
MTKHGGIGRDAANAPLAFRSRRAGKSLRMSWASFTARWAVVLALPAFLAFASPALAEVVKEASKGDRELGQHLSSLCVTCHQITGQATGGVPPIIAWPQDQFIAVMQSYRAKDRDNQVMQSIATPLSDEDIAALAAYFGALPSQPDLTKK